MTLDGVGPAGWWLIAAAALAIAELAAPGVFLVFLALAAGITGLALLALPDLPLAAQIASFAAWSVVSVMIGRRWYKDYPIASEDALLNDRAARLIGETVTVEVAIEHGAKDGHLVDYADEINPSWLEGVGTVGVTSGASVPEVLVRDVLQYLADRGYEDVKPVTAAEESLLFALPNELRRDLKARGDTGSHQVRHDAGSLR